MGFHHFIIDIRDEFGDWVIDNFVEEYLAGRTPNPCILCNTHIKWAALLRRADALDCEFIATGHYAQVRRDTDTQRYIVSKGLDTNKGPIVCIVGLTTRKLSPHLVSCGRLPQTPNPPNGARMGLYRFGKKKPRAMKFVLSPTTTIAGF
jgi:tRNA-specific 2-thiouridylase